MRHAVRHVDAVGGVQGQEEALGGGGGGGARRAHMGGLVASVAWPAAVRPLPGQLLSNDDRKTGLTGLGPHITIMQCLLHPICIQTSTIPPHHATGHPALDPYRLWDGRMGLW